MALCRKVVSVDGARQYPTVRAYQPKSGLFGPTFSFARLLQAELSSQTHFWQVSSLWGTLWL